VKTIVPRGASAPDSRPLRRDRYRVAGASIALEKAPMLFEARWCEFIFDPGPQNAIRTAIEAAIEVADGDALSLYL
jgi:hypothetical protein